MWNIHHIPDNDHLDDGLAEFYDNEGNSLTHANS